MHAISSFFLTLPQEGSLPAKQTVSFFGRVISFISGCSFDEKSKAGQLMLIHNLIEEVAYRAFAEKIVSLNLVDDQISEQQSGDILAHIKKQAHIEMYKKDGYIAKRAQLLDPSQVQKVIASVGKIVHDRDTKLTDARYPSLSEMLMGLDDHNTMVKEILIQSWYKLEEFTDSEHEHLDMIKKNVSFYEMVDKQLKFDLKAELSYRKAFWDHYFPGMRKATEDMTQTDTTRNFVEIMEVRALFQGFTLNEERCHFDSLHEADLGEKLFKYLSSSDQELFFEPRKVFNQVRGKSIPMLPLIKNESITVKEFISRYFPERASSPS